jgi:hypothetical protein
LIRARASFKPTLTQDLPAGHPFIPQESSERTGLPSKAAGSLDGVPIELIYDRGDAATGSVVLEHPPDHRGFGLVHFEALADERRVTVRVGLPRVGARRVPAIRIDHRETSVGSAQPL